MRHLTVIVDVGAGDRRPDPATLSETPGDRQQRDHNFLWSAGNERGRVAAIATVVRPGCRPRSRSLGERRTRSGQAPARQRRAGRGGLPSHAWEGSERRRSGRALVSKYTVRRLGIERCQSRIEAEPRPAVGTEDRVRLAHIDVDVRVILRWGLADTLEFPHPNADFGDAAVVPELQIAAAGHRFRPL